MWIGQMATSMTSMTISRKENSMTEKVKFDEATITYDEIADHQGHAVRLFFRYDEAAGLECVDCFTDIVYVYNKNHNFEKCNHSSVVITNLLGETTCLQCGEENK